MKLRAHLYPWTLTVLFLLLGGGLSGQDSSAVNDTILIHTRPPRWPLLINPLIGTSDHTTTPGKQTVKERFVNGYRVQVLATRSTEKADQLKAALQQKVDWPVYIQFESPNYKVRVGDFLTRKEADRARKSLRGLGYKTAWVVQSRVVVREP